MRKLLLFLGICIITICSAIFIIRLQHLKPLEETITFFPLDQSVSYTKAETSLNMLKEMQNRNYSVDWIVASTLDRKAFLRQDLGLLFENGRLRGKLGKWKASTSSISQEQSVSGKESAKFEGITFHYSELHEKNGTINSSQKMSEDRLYVIPSSGGLFQAFQFPKNKAEKNWQQTLDQKTRDLLKNSLRKAATAYRINLANYSVLPLTSIINYQNQPIPGYSQKETADIIGRLWEGIYKNYYLGIKKSNGTIANPINSTIPLLLFPKNSSDLLVVTETADGESIILKQMIRGHD